MAVGRRHHALRLWATLQELRLLRLGEEWNALKRAVQRLELRAQRDADLPTAHKETLMAAAEVSRGWLEVPRRAQRTQRVLPGDRAPA